jgi:hypothetical protein
MLFGFVFKLKNKKGVEPTGVGELLPNREHAVRHVGRTNIIQKKTKCNKKTLR